MIFLGVNIQKRALIVFLVLTLSGCALKRLEELQPIYHDSFPIEKTSVIRPASEEERTYKPNKWVHIFANPAGIAHLYSITPVAEPAKEVKLKKYYGARVEPGSYYVGVQCFVGGFVVTFKVEIEALSGHQHLFECTGAAAGRAKVKHWSEEITL